MNFGNKILDWINLLKTKPKLIIGEKDINYEILKIYLEGYVDAYSQMIDFNIRKDISLWFQKRIGEQTSIYWTDHIRNFYKDESDDELKSILLSVTEEYFKQFLLTIRF